MYQCPSQTPRKHWNQLISRKSSHFIPPQNTGKPIVFWSLQGVLNENTVQKFVEESLGNELVKLPAVCRQWRYSSNFTVTFNRFLPTRIGLLFQTHFFPIFLFKSHLTSALMFSGGGVEGAGSKGDARNIYLENVLTGWKYFRFFLVKKILYLKFWNFQIM